MDNKATYEIPSCRCRDQTYPKARAGINENAAMMVKVQRPPCTSRISEQGPIQLFPLHYHTILHSPYTRARRAQHQPMPTELLIQQRHLKAPPKSDDA